MSSKSKVFLLTLVTDGVSTDHKVEGDQCTIGRHPENNLVVSHAQVSRHHLKFFSIGDQVVVTDLGSSNGTFLGKTRLPAKQNIEIEPDDELQLGTDGPRLKVMLQLLPGEKSEKTKAEKTIEKVLEKQKQDTHIEKPAPAPILEPIGPTPLAKPVAQPNINATNKEFEKIITDARKHASKILAEAEMQAEQKAQEAYQRVIETEQRADKIFQDRMKESHIEAEKFSKSAREETLALLQESRTKAKTIRDQAEETAKSLRDSAEKKCQELITLAEKQGLELKNQRLSEADVIIEQKGIEILKGTREKMEAELKAHSERLSSELKEHQLKIDNERSLFDSKISAELTEHNLKISEERSATAAKISADIESHNQKMASDIEAHNQKIFDELAAHTQKMTAERADFDRRISSETEDHQQKIQSLREELKTLAEKKQQNESEIIKAQSEIQKFNKELEKISQETKKQETTLAGLKGEEKASKEHLLQLQEEIKKQSETKQISMHELEKLSVTVSSLKQDKEQREHEAQSQIQALKARFEEEKSRFNKEEEDRTNNLKLETVKSVKKLEKEMIDEILAKKAQKAREIMLELEASCKSLSVNRDWNAQKPFMQEKIEGVLAGSSQSLDPNYNPEQTVKKAIAQRRREKVFAGAIGFALCALTLWGVGKVIPQVNELSPLQRMVASAADAKKEDLIARKFNPDQTSEVRETYVDSVIYTKNFSTIYLDPTYQEAWNKAATLYLLKTWRIEEDRSTKALSMSAALVSELTDRKDKIHPDFIEKGITQMHEIEAASLERLKTELGGEVRLESFKKFEKRFFEKHSQK